MSLERIDKILLKKFPELTRSKVQSLIEKKRISYMDSKGLWRLALKPGMKLDAVEALSMDWRIDDDEELHFVSRGSLKLLGAMESFEIKMSDCICWDVGLSTGGFTDVMLQKGAKKVLGTDVGTGQLHPSLVDHPNLVWRDKIHAKQKLDGALLKEFFGEMPYLFDRVVVDVSFISVTQILENLAYYLKPEGWLIVLVKPQFELGKNSLNRKGVVKDPSEIDVLLQKMIGVFQKNGLNIENQSPSPIEGENGNQEVFVLARHL